MKFLSLLFLLATLLSIACQPVTEGEALMQEDTTQRIAEVDPAQILFVEQTQAPALFHRATHESIYVFS